VGDRPVLPGGIVALPSQDPLLCAPAEKAQLETNNTAAQLEYIEHVVEQAAGDGGTFRLRESHVLELQRIAVDGIYPCAGQYRSVTRTAELVGGGATLQIPEPALVPGLVRDAIDHLNGAIGPGGQPSVAMNAAAWALWRFNWIHPFAGGNGRTARAVAYLILCADWGRLIPGKPSLPTLMSQRRVEALRALRLADASQDVSVLAALVARCMIEQLRSVASLDPED
jgi:Fic family protein